MARDGDSGGGGGEGALGVGEAFENWDISKCKGDVDIILKAASK